MTASHYQVSAAIYFPTADDIDAALDEDPIVELLENLFEYDGGADSLHIWKTIYLPCHAMNNRTYTDYNNLQTRGSQKE